MAQRALSTHQPPAIIKLLANEVRWGLLKALAVSDHQVGELVALTHQPINLISYHLRKMRADQLVITRRSEADARDVYYSADLARLRQLYFEAGEALHPILGAPLTPSEFDQLPFKRILFICTHNSARSQMAEGLLRHLSHGQLHVVSAGSEPTEVHPDAIRTLEAMGIDIRAHRARSLADFASESFDFVITVCDKAREVCPTFPGGASIHWGYADPVLIEDDLKRAALFEQIALHLRSRIGYFLSTLKHNA
jgi:protein-tyrosine-phosphatase/DNA-binding MarR family transcriptional regulator